MKAAARASSHTLVMKVWLGALLCAAFSMAAAQHQHGSPAAVPAARQAAPVAGDGDAFSAPHPWVVPSPRWQPDAYFSNLADGADVEAPFVARFGLSLRGIVPAGKTVGNAGHHHLLIDQPLPLDFQKPLPFTAQYVHFGKGQMEAVVDLPPGPHTLRLVLADQGHIPYFVFSKPLIVHVTKQNKGVAPAAVLGAPRIEVLSPADRARVTVPLRVQMHASGFNLSNVATRVPDTGHFRLTLERVGGKAEVIDLPSGQTEVWLNPPKGDYGARLELVSNAGNGEVMAQGQPGSFIVP